MPASVTETFFLFVLFSKDSIFGDAKRQLRIWSFLARTSWEDVFYLCCIPDHRNGYK